MDLKLPLNPRLDEILQRWRACSLQKSKFTAYCEKEAALQPFASELKKHDFPVEEWTKPPYLIPKDIKNQAGLGIIRAIYIALGIMNVDRVDLINDILKISWEIQSGTLYPILPTYPGTTTGNNLLTCSSFKVHAYLAYYLKTMGKHLSIALNVSGLYSEMSEIAEKNLKVREYRKS